MNYSEAVNFITKVEKFGSVFGLDTVRELLKRLGHPDRDLRFVHVAGTNGKGSVCAMLSSVLKVAGYKVGTFNSPSVFRYNERYLVDGKQIDDESLARLLTKVSEVREQMATNGFAKPTAFEIELAVAFLWFCECGCDIVVLETGLGGRLDATNVIERKELAIITSIALDHTKVLGSSLLDIAKEKVAIVKDCALVTFKQDDDVMSVLSQVQDLRIAQSPKSISDNIKSQGFEIDNVEYTISLLGAHQLENASLVVLACKVLREKGYTIDETAVKLGLSSAKWQGRIQVVNVADSKGQKKSVVLDGAHNPSGAKTLQTALMHYFTQKKVVLVLGVFCDKDISGIVSAICPSKDKIITVTPPTERGYNADLLTKRASKFCSNTTCAESIEKGVRIALESDCEVVCVCGSLSILREAQKEISRYEVRYD